MERIIQLKTWQIFLIILASVFLTKINFGVESELNGYLSALGYLILGIYYMSIGSVLHEVLNNKFTFNLNFFLFNSFVCIAVFSSIAILSDNNGMTFNGIEAIPFLYLVYAYFHVLIFNSRILMSLEKNKKCSTIDSLGYFFLFLFLPIGVLSLHSKIRNQYLSHID